MDSGDSPSCITELSSLDRAGVSSQGQHMSVVCELAVIGGTPNNMMDLNNTGLHDNIEKQTRYVRPFM